MSLTFCLLILVWNMSCTGKYDLKLNQMNINANVIKHYPDWWRTRVKTETLKVDEHTKQKIIQDRWPLTPDDLLQCLPVILMMLWICLFFHLKAVFLCMMYWNVHLLIGFFFIWFFVVTRSWRCQLNLCIESFIFLIWVVEAHDECVCLCFIIVTVLQQSHGNIFCSLISSKPHYY